MILSPQANHFTLPIVGRQAFEPLFECRKALWAVFLNRDEGLSETQGRVQGETEDGYSNGSINKVRQSLVLRKC